MQYLLLHKNWTLCYFNIIFYFEKDELHENPQK